MAYPTSSTRTSYVSTEAVGDVVASANFNKGPGGVCGYARISADSTPAGTGTTTVNGLQVTFGASSLRFYKITISCWGIVTTGINTTTIEIWDSSAGVSLAGVGLTLSFAGSNWQGDSCVAYHQVASSGSQTYSFRVSASSGTVGILATASGSNNRYADILVQDIGPAF